MSDDARTIWVKLHAENWRTWVTHFAQALGMTAVTFYINQWGGVSVEMSYLNAFFVPTAAFGHREISDLLTALFKKLRGKELTDKIGDGLGDFFSAVIAVALFVMLHSLGVLP